MNITEILPDTEEYAITRKLLRDVDFHMDVKHLTAICNNNIEVGYIESLAMNDIIEWTKKKFGKKTVTLEIIKTNTPDSSAEMKALGTIEGSGVLRRDYNFDNFIAGSSNKVALASAIKISRSQPGQKASNNFLYIHGGVGLGKTHLLHAVMNNLIAKGKNIAFFNGSEFADYILQAVNQQGVSYTQTMQLFKQVDALASRRHEQPDRKREEHCLLQRKRICGLHPAGSQPAGGQLHPDHAAVQTGRRARSG